MILKHKSLLFPLLLVFYEMATYLSNDMYLPALPQMMTDLKLSLDEAQFTLTMWFLGACSMPLIVGALADRFGRRSILLLGGIIYIIASMLCAMTHDYFIFLVGRFFEGGMVSFMIVPGYACIHEAHEQKNAIRMLALMGSISVLAPALGPLFGGIVLIMFSWRGIFWVITLWSFVAILLLAKHMPETLPADKRHPLNLPSLMGHYAKIITNKQFLIYAAIGGFTFAGFIAWITAGPLLAMDTFQYSAVAFGIIQAVVFLATIIAARSVKYAMEWIGIKKLIRVSLSITFTGGLIMLLSAWFAPQHFYGFLAGMVVYSFGSGLNFSSLSRLAIDACSEPMGMRVAISTVFTMLFGVLGSAMSGFVFTGSSLSLASLTFSAIAIACFFSLFIPRGQ
ncbi:MAG: multidrug effflux MFS transporter [Gammaproteobacteria bacterium]